MAAESAVLWLQMSKPSTAAARENLRANGVKNVFMVRMSSEEFVDAWRSKTPKNRLAGLDMDALDLQTLVVDPPRAGLDKGTEQLMSEFERIVYVSCNPETLHANLQCVKETHDVRDFALFDQFPYTHHIECGVHLVRKTCPDADEAKV
jgi:tRNA (uracil-5-)-methyltransferase